MLCQNNITKFNVALYIRLSREDGDKDESNSVQNQRRLLLDFINNHENFILYDIYIDDGYTGTNFNRPNFQRMLNDIENGNVNCVAVKDLSRFGRDYIDSGHFLERVFPKLNVRFIAVTNNIDSFAQSYDISLPIQNIFNEQYSRDISRKVHSTIKTKQKAGEFIGAFASYGYRKSPTDKHKLIIDEYASEIVKRIFNMYIRGFGKLTIAKTLNAEGILCPSEYKKLNGENYRNCNRLERTNYWTYSTVNVILKNELYIGNMVQGKKHQQLRSKARSVECNQWIRVKHTHEPIIDLQTWNNVQKLLTQKHRDLDFETNLSIYAGFIKCGDCGRSMAKTTWKYSDGTKKILYTCGTYKRSGNQFCTAHTLPLHILNEIILNDLKQIIQNIGNLQELVQTQSFNTFNIRKSIDVELSKLHLELSKVKKHNKSLYEAYASELISESEFRSYKNDYQEKEKLYAKQIETLEKKKNEQITPDIFEVPWIKRLLELKDIEKIDREIVVEMIDQIIVFKNQKIKISYNFSDELSYLFSSVYEATDETII